MATDLTDALPAGATTPSLWRSAATTIGARAIDLPSRYGFHLLVAWKLGVVDAGAFYIVFSVLTLAAGCGRLGIDRAMTREVARSMALGDAALARDVMRRGLWIVAGLSLLAGSVLAVAAPLLARMVFGNPGLTLPIVCAAACIVPLCLSAGAAGALAGLHRIGVSQMVYSWLWPALFCVVAVAAPLTLDRALLLMVLAITTAAAASGALLWWFWPRTGGVSVPRRQPALFALGWSLFTTEIVQLLLSALPALVLGGLSSEAAVGAYAMAWRLALVLNLLVVAVAAMASPRFAVCAAHDDVAGLQRTAAHSLGLVLGMGIGPMVVLGIWAPHFLGAFGPGFASGTVSLRLLLLGQFVLMLSATTPELMAMTGHERAMQRVNVAAILIYLPVLVALAWLIGDEGAAIANLVIALITAVGASWLSRKWYGFTPLGALARTLAARFA